MLSDPEFYELDPLLEESIRFVIKECRPSILAVQRQFKIGYNRAARIIEQLECVGVVTSQDLNGNRAVIGVVDSIALYLEMASLYENSVKKAIYNQKQKAIEESNSFETERKIESVTNRKIIIWLQNTEQLTYSGDEIHILKSFAPFEHLFSKQKRHKELDYDSCSDILNGYKFTAIMQCRTPLSVLVQHGRLEKKPMHRLPLIAKEQWQGVWIPVLKSYRELGMDVNEIPMGTMASEIGQIPEDGGDYLRFLIFARTIKESKGSNEEKHKLIDLGMNMYGQDGMALRPYMEKYSFWG